MIDDPIPPGHGEPGNVGAIPRQSYADELRRIDDLLDRAPRIVDPALRRDLGRRRRELRDLIEAQR